MERPGTGHTNSGIRPALVITNTITMAAITSLLLGRFASHNPEEWLP
jgi:hypothetical protein